MQLLLVSAVLAFLDNMVRGFATGVGIMLTTVASLVMWEDGTPTLACGLAAGGSGTFVVGSYVGVISQKVALLTRLLAGDKLDPVVSEKQPAH